MKQERSESTQAAAHAEMLANRVAKNARHRRRWARRNGVSCYRLYDRDIPEVPLAIDFYDGRLLLSHFVADEFPVGAGWLEAMTSALAERLEICRDDVYVKERVRQRGDAQYTRLAATGRRFQVGEGGHRFWINLSDYLDSGLFLDHRGTRALVGGAAGGRRVLNLFAYTGSFTVYAAAGGALSSTTVDMSKPYCSWARDNLALNDIDESRHPVIESDVFRFLDDAAGRGDRYDLAVVDPPTFSNSKRMTASFDVQRDHVALLERVAAVIEPRATVYFSTSRRKFRLDVAGLAALGYAAEEITGRTVPVDFAQRRPHRCYALTSAPRNASQSSST